MKINNTNTQHYRNSEHLAFMSEIREKLKNYDPTSVDVKPEMIEIFDEAVNKEDESFKMVIASDFTKQLSEIDTKRDLVITGFLMQVRCFLSYGEEKEKEMAHRIMIEYDDLKGDIRKKNYPAQSSDTKSFIESSRTKLQGEIEMLFLTQWIDRIEQYNTDFMTLYNNRQQQEAEKDNLQRLKDSRLKADAAYTTIIDRINAAIVFNGEEKYKALVLDLNVTIDYYNNILATRQGRAKAKKEDEGTEGTEEPIPEKEH